MRQALNSSFDGVTTATIMPDKRDHNVAASLIILTMDLKDTVIKQLSAPIRKKDDHPSPVFPNRGKCKILHK